MPVYSEPGCKYLSTFMESGPAPTQQEKKPQHNFGETPPHCLTLYSLSILTSVIMDRSFLKKGSIQFNCVVPH